MNLGKVQIFLKEGTPAPNTVVAVVSFPIGDADELYAFHRANGVGVVEEIGDRAYGLRGSAYEVDVEVHRGVEEETRD
jgi:hypothetical protein